MRCILAGLAFIGAFGAAHAIAADAAGFYAGIYGGPSQRSAVDVDFSALNVLFSGPGTVESPTSVENGGIDPRLFSALNDVLIEAPYADAGVGGGLVADGIIAFDRAPIIGGVVGYAFGNGLRAELDYSSAQHDVATLEIKDAIIGTAAGAMNPDGTWTWVDGGFFPIGSLEPTPIESLFGSTTFYTRAEFLLLNAWYDIDTGTALTPYVGGGAGLARLTTYARADCTCGDSYVLGEDTAYVPAGQLGAGIKVKLAAPVSLDLGYRMKVANSSVLDVNDIEGTDFLLFAQTGVRQHGIVVVNAITAGLTFALN